MKKVFRNNRLILIAFFTVFTTAASSVAVANDSTARSTAPVELKFIGHVNDQPLFQMNFFGTSGENEFSIVIRDEFGNSVFRELIKGHVFSKKFLLTDEVLGDEAIRFEVTERKSKRTVVFEVNRNLSYEEKMVVSTVK